MEVREILSNAFGVVRVRMAGAAGVAPWQAVEHARRAASNAARAPVEFLYSVDGPDGSAQDFLFSGPRR
jgi:hypothetical protein